MNNLRKTIKLMLAALLLAVTFISAKAQDDDEVEITPQLQAALEKYDEVQYFNEGMACVCVNGKYGYVNARGEEVVPCKYDEAEPFCCGLALVKSRGKYGFINTSGELVEPFKYDDPTEVFFPSCWILGLNGKYGVAAIDNSIFELIIPFKYDFMDSFSLIDKAEAIVKLNGKCGVISIEDEIIIPIKFDCVEYAYDRMWSVSLNGKYGFFNNDGEEVVPCKYDGTTFFYDSIAMVNLNGKFGFINIQGEEFIPCKYDIVEWFENGLSRVVSKGRCGYVDTNGSFSFLHNVTIKDIDWLASDWETEDGECGEPVLTIKSNGEVEEGISERKKRNASLVYHKETDIYTVVCYGAGQETYYQVDLANQKLINMDGMVLKIRTRETKVEIFHHQQNKQ